MKFGSTQTGLSRLLLCSSFFWLIFAHAGPIDMGKYLESRQLTPVEGPAGIPTDAMTAPFLSFFAKDAFLNISQVLIPPDNDALYAQILVIQQLLELLEMPNNPALPTTLLKTEKTAPHAPRTAESWVAAFVQPTYSIQNLQPYLPGSSLTATQLAQLMNHYVFCYVFGLVTVQPSLVEGDVISSAVGIPLVTFGNPENQDSLDRYLRQINIHRQGNVPVAQLRALAFPGNEKDRTRFLNTLNYFLSRLEALIRPGLSASPPLHLKLFSPALEKTRLADKARLLRRMEKRIKAVRHELIQHLSGLSTKFRSEFPEAIPFLLDPVLPHFEQFALSFSDPTPVLAKDWEFDAKRYLLYFLNSPKIVRERIWRDWQAQLQVADPIEVVVNHATTYDKHLYLLSSHSFSLALRQKEEGNSQWSLNRSMPPSTLVAAPTDFESQRILDIGRRIQPVLTSIGTKLDIYPEKELELYSPGQAINREDLRKALQFAQTSQSRLLLLIEMGGFKQWMQALSEEYGVKIVAIDHHGQAAGKVGALELFIHIYNYLPWYRDWVTAIIDRSGIRGLLDLGLTQGEIREWLSLTGQLNRVERINEQIRPLLEDNRFQIDPNRLIITTLPRGVGVSSASLPIGYVMLPHPLNLIVQSPNLNRVIAPFPVCQSVQALVDSSLNARTLLSGDLQTGLLKIKTNFARDVPRHNAVIIEALMKTNRYSCLVELEGGLFIRKDR